ncbi:hypothetical protein [Mycobacterium arosiense]|nr:hypothetical protein [Mycobacterium arosiense]
MMKGNQTDGLSEGQLLRYGIGAAATCAALIATALALRWKASELPA